MDGICLCGELQEQPGNLLIPDEDVVGPLDEALMLCSFRMARAIAIAPAMVIMKRLSSGIRGFKTMVAQIPPAGETQARPSLPTPPVCSSAMITRPCSCSGSVSPASLFPIQLVDVVRSKWRICRPMTCVRSFSGSRTEGACLLPLQGDSLPPAMMRYGIPTFGVHVSVSRLLNGLCPVALQFARPIPGRMLLRESLIR